MALQDLTLSPLLATVIFCATCLAGYQYRRVWKAEGPIYQYWLFGVSAGLGLCVLGFIPLQLPG